MLKGFKDFLLRGNIVDLAVAVVIGTAFVALVTAFTESFIDPLLAAAGGGAVGEGLGLRLRSDDPATFIDIGGFLTAVVAFCITAAVVYVAVVVPMQKVAARLLQPEGEEAVVTDTALLSEIRDLLAAQAGGRPGGTSGGAR
jgi:large conductance mechanosensitive channel